MGWREVSVADQRREFLALAGLADANVSALCARFGISRQTGHLWLRRQAEGDSTFEDRSRRPHASPRRIEGEVAARIVAVRQRHPAWGARKIAAVLARDGNVPPAVSSVHAVLVRAGLVCPKRPDQGPFGSFEHERPNAMWQMDFKGREKIRCGTWVHPLTVIDDHSRFAVGLVACGNQRTDTVKSALTDIFRHHGLPDSFYVDNGSPWGGGVPGQWTPLRVWLLKMGVSLIHATPYRPQGRGKNERFHRTLIAEVFALKPLDGMGQVQQAFAQWRHVYNHERPHEALGMQPPSSRYSTSSRSMPEHLAAPEYDQGEIIRKVGANFTIGFRARSWHVPQAFAGEYVAIRPRLPDGTFSICFGATEIAKISLKEGQNEELEV